MADTTTPGWPASREQLLHALYEAAEIEHNLMCTYLYAAFSLKSGVEEGLTAEEAEATARWRRAVLDVAIDEMGHLAAVWNITSALGGQPRFGRGNFPLDFGLLPAGIVVKLAPFTADVLQHFIYLERPGDSPEPEGDGFTTRLFRRGSDAPRLTPMPLDYDTVGVFYHELSATLQRFSESHGESIAFIGDAGLQLGPAEIDLGGAKPVICLKTALQAFDAIVTEGEGASEANATSHFCTFRNIRDEFAALKAKNPDFVPAWPAAVNPVLRRPPTPEGKVWIEAPEAVATVDLANSSYQLMLRLLAYSYGVKRPHPEKAAAVDLAISLMRAATLLGERAARLPAGPSNPNCHAGMSFTALRDSAAFAQGEGARLFFVERLKEFAEVGARLAAGGDSRASAAAKLIAG
ncbi:MAG: ferritin-like domain-containing protein, partial [Alphaproteobacteria bacterium]